MLNSSFGEGLHAVLIGSSASHVNFKSNFFASGLSTHQLVCPSNVTVIE